MFLFANQAQTTITGTINSTATTVTLASGTGALFPTVTTASGDKFALCHINSGGHADEIAYCTNRSGDVLTIARGQEGTTNIQWNAGETVASLITAAQLSGFEQDLSEPTPHGFYRYDSNGSLTVPSNWKAGTNIAVSACAGGGAGGAYLPAPGLNIMSGSGGGGAGQAIVSAVHAVNPGDVISFTIGAGGILNTSNGGNTVISVNGSPVETLLGGQNGQPGVLTTGSPGSHAAAGYGGSGYPNGGDGQAVLYQTPGTAGGGEGGSGPFGGAGTSTEGTGSSVVNGHPAYGYGVGGGGGPGKHTGDSGSQTQVSQPGMPGLLIIHY